MSVTEARQLNISPDYSPELNLDVPVSLPLDTGKRRRGEGEQAHQIMSNGKEQST
eukprot:COSAG06_NODE_411_length_16063_cov_12.216738_17_plen_55_part_00